MIYLLFVKINIKFDNNNLFSLVNIMDVNHNQAKADTEAIIALLETKIKEENEKQISIKKQMKPIEEQLKPLQNQIQNSLTQQIELKKQIAIALLEYYQLVKKEKSIDLDNLKRADVKALSTESLEQVFIIKHGYAFVFDYDEEALTSGCSDEVEWKQWYRLKLKNSLYRVCVK